MAAGRIVGDGEGFSERELVMGIQWRGARSWSGRRMCRCGAAAAAPGGARAVAEAAQGRWRSRRKGGGDNDGILVAGARSGGDGGWTPSPAFREQPLEREETHLFFQ